MGFTGTLRSLRRVRISVWGTLFGAAIVLWLLQQASNSNIAGLSQQEPLSNFIFLEPPKDEQRNLDIRRRVTRAIGEAKDLINVALAEQPELSQEEKLARTNLSAAEQTRERNEGYRRNAFNQYLSDRISLHRPLKDPRHHACLEQQYPIDQMPDTSVIIIFHNEARSTLLRTVFSVLDRSPPSLLKEIILVDDASTMAHLREPLDTEMRAYPKVRILRLPSRSGLIRARVYGADIAQGKVLTFLDSHCECNVGWLEPLLDRIRINKTIVVTPVIDNIDHDNFHYSGSAVVNTRGIFTWSLTFSWLDLPYYMAQQRSNPIEPLRSPTMAGGLFSMDRDYFYSLGSYDLNMDVWGGENLEISFRIWMCGGTLEFIPCSRVGHVYRDHHPYQFPNGTLDTINRNLNRVAEVWLDEYKEIYYRFRPYHRHLGTGDIAARKALRERLQCRSFKWYIENVFPDMFVPTRENCLAHGLVRNRKADLCLDTGSARMADMKPRLSPCTAFRETNEWYLSKNLHEIRHESTFGNRCLDSSDRKPMSKVELWGCHSMQGNQEWRHLRSGQLQHVPSQMCLEAAADGAGYKLVMNTCNERSPNQSWEFSEYDEYHG